MSGDEGAVVESLGVRRVHSPAVKYATGFGPPRGWPTRDEYDTEPVKPVRVEPPAWRPTVGTAVHSWLERALILDNLARTDRGEPKVVEHDTEPVKPKVYVAGPMRGYPQFNFPAFDQAAFDLRALGWEVFNPAEADRAQHGSMIEESTTGNLDEITAKGFDLRKALGEDLSFITGAADAVAVLPGWADSKGARAEVATARALGIPVCHVDGFRADGGLEKCYLVDVWPQEDESAASVEIRTTSSTGGEKGVKLARYDLIPAGPLRTLAEHYGRGARKYDDHQWRRGYEWSKSFAALMRHAWAFWGGEDVDTETGSPHLAAVAWHAFALLEFAEAHPEHDDRPGGQ